LVQPADTADGQDRQRSWCAFLLQGQSQRIGIVFVTISGQDNHAVRLREAPEHTIWAIARERNIGEGDKPQRYHTLQADNRYCSREEPRIPIEMVIE
jgi:hypothetical protein